MKAIAINDFGAPPNLHDLPVPEPGEGEVLVRVRASSVNGFDVAVAGGYLKGVMEHHFPVVLGKDFAGTVEAAGPGVQSLRPGEVVFGVITKAALGDGAFGEYVTAPEAYTARVPAGLDLATARGAYVVGTAGRGRTMPTSATSVPATPSTSPATFPRRSSPCAPAASTPWSTSPATAWNWRTC